MAIYIAIAYKGGCLKGPQYVVCAKESEEAVREEAELRAGDSYGVMIYAVPDTWGKESKTADWRVLRAVYTSLLEGDRDLGIVAYLPSEKGEGIAQFLECEEEE